MFSCVLNQNNYNLLFRTVSAGRRHACSKTQLCCINVATDTTYYTTVIGICAAAAKLVLSVGVMKSTTEH